MHLEKIYKRDEIGSVRQWWVELNGLMYRTHTGVIGGETIRSQWTKCEGKNIGRSNESTPEEQCKTEVKAMYKKKLKRGYTKDIDDIDKTKQSLVSPMLAHRYEDYHNKIVFPVFTQPKLDGFRCIARADGLWSRKSEPLTTVPHIAEPLIELCKETGLVFDGELYNHDLHGNFNALASLIRRVKTDAKHIAKVRDTIQYHIYDIIDQGTPFSRRWMQLRQMKKQFPESVLLVETRRALSATELDDDYDEYLESMYEGQMIRVDSVYERKRTKNLLKRKEYIDEEFTILGISEGKGKREGTVGFIAYKTKEGKDFTAPLMGTDSYRKRIWKERKEMLGKDATVRFFHYTPDGKPRFPRTKTIIETSLC